MVGLTADDQQIPVDADDSVDHGQLQPGVLHPRPLLDVEFHVAVDVLDVLADAQRRRTDQAAVGRRQHTLLVPERDRLQRRRRRVLRLVQRPQHLDRRE